MNKISIKEPNLNNWAKLAINKSLLKEFSRQDNPRVVYMDNGVEFEIQLFNPTTKIIGASLTINGDKQNDVLVIYPGQRIWLDRYLDKPNKFLFKTYEVDDNDQVRKAIANNGVIKIDFFYEREKEAIYISSTPWNQPLKTTYDWYNGNVTSITTSGNSGISTFANTVGVELTTSCNCFLSQSSIETGRVNAGGYSDQKFQNAYNDFEYFPFRTETIHIFPSSRKPVTKSDLNRRYCPSCGKRINPKFKYCPSCGAKQ